MSHHFSRNTIAVPKFCNKCKKEQPHRIGANHKVGPCLECLFDLDPKILTPDEMAYLRPEDGSFVKTAFTPLCSCIRLKFPHVRAEDCAGKPWIYSFMEVA